MPEVNSNDIPFNETARKRAQQKPGNSEEGIEHRVNSIVAELTSDPSHASPSLQSIRPDRRSIRFVIFCLLLILIIWFVANRSTSNTSSDNKNSYYNKRSHVSGDRKAVVTPNIPDIKAENSLKDKKATKGGDTETHIREHAPYISPQQFVSKAAPVTPLVQETQLPHASPRASLSSYTLDFGEITVQKHGYRTSEFIYRSLHVTNLGSGNLIIDRVDPPYAPFKIIRNECSSTLYPQQRCEILISFSPVMTYQVAPDIYEYNDTFKSKLQLHTNDGVETVELLGKSSYKPFNGREFRIQQRYGNMTRYDIRRRY